MNANKEDLRNRSEHFVDFIGGMNLLKLSKEQAANPKNVLSFKSLKSYPSVDFSDTIQEFVDSMLNTELVINTKRMSQVTEAMKQAIVMGENTALFQELRNHSKETAISKDLDLTNDNNLCLDSKRMMITSKVTRDSDIPVRGRVPIENFDLEQFMQLKENSSAETRDANLKILISGFVWEVQQLREKICQMKVPDNSFVRGFTNVTKAEKSRFNRLANHPTDLSKQEGDLFKLDSDNLDNKNVSNIGRTADGHINLLNHLAITNSNFFFAETVQECGDLRSPDQGVGAIESNAKWRKPPTDLVPDELVDLGSFFSNKALRQEVAFWETKLLAKERKLENIVNKLLKHNIPIKPTDNWFSFN